MKYLVFMEDEHFNNYYIGVFKELNNAVPEINKFLSVYGKQIDELTEYMSTYNNCFDEEIEVDEQTYVWIRGFILSEEDLKEVD